MQEDNRIEKNEYGLDLSVPKELLLPAMDFIRAYAAPETAKPGTVLVEGFMATDANLVVTGK